MSELCIASQYSTNIHVSMPSVITKVNSTFMFMFMHYIVLLLVVALTCEAFHEGKTCKGQVSWSEMKVHQVKRTSVQCILRFTQLHCTAIWQSILSYHFTPLSLFLFLSLLSCPIQLALFTVLPLIWHRVASGVNTMLITVNRPIGMGTSISIGCLLLLLCGVLPVNLIGTDSGTGTGTNTIIIIGMSHMIGLFTFLTLLPCTTLTLLFLPCVNWQDHDTIM